MLSFDLTRPRTTLENEADAAALAAPGVQAEPQEIDYGRTLSGIDASPARDCVPVRSMHADDFAALLRIDRHAMGRERDGYIRAKMMEALDRTGVRVSLVAELDGTQGMRARLPVWKQLYIRWRFLPGILRAGRFPKTRAPREIRPAGEPRAKAVVLEALTADARRFEDGLTEARANGGGALTHPFFGRLRPVKMLGLITAHTEHHRRQLPGD